MQSNINNNEQDPFSEFFRQKLENHQLPVDANSWNEIKERLKSKRRIIPFWFWLSGGAAVAVLALLFTLSPLSESPELMVKSKTTDIKQKYIETERVEKQQIQVTTLIEKVPTKQTGTNNQLTNEQEQTIIETTFAQIHTINSDTTESNIIIENTTGNNLKPEAVAQTAIENKDSVIDKKTTRIISNSLTENTIEKPIVKSKNKQSWLLAATFGPGGTNLSSTNGYALEKNGNVGLSFASNSYTNIMSANDFSQKNYLPPVSVGLIIGKDLDKTISIETGLVYTYLVSTFENNGVQHNNANLKLHYLGIPLNLVVKLWNNPKWDIYLSGGMMVEKGLRSIYTQNEYYGYQTYTTTAKTRIDGLQWSVNTSFGATYKIRQNWGIYFEPKFSYFFDNNQPVSARTEYPVVIGLTVGVRIKF